MNYGWQGYIRLQDAADANNRDFLDFFLQQMAAAQVTDGRRVLDVLDVHWYPEATGGGVRVTEDNVDGGSGGRAQAGATQPLGSELHRDQLDHAVQHAGARSA